MSTLLRNLFVIGFSAAAMGLGWGLMKYTSFSKEDMLAVSTVDSANSKIFLFIFLASSQVISSNYSTFRNPEQCT